MPPSPDGGGPADPDRLVSLDLVRGVAVMGILLMNIQSFAMPEAAYLNPAAYGGARGGDLTVWVAELILVDGKMRGLFSWLFGASLLLVATRAGARAASVHYRRMATLFGFGLAHCLLVWDGDILMHYALVGALAFRWRHAPVERLVAAAIAFLLVQLLIDLGPPLVADRLAAATRLSPADAHDFLDMRDQFGVPRAATIAHQLALHHAGWGALVAARWRELPGIIVGTLGSFGCETLAYMLLGMASLRSGLLAGAWPRATYRRWALVGLGAGGAGFALLAAWVIACGFDFRAVAWEALVWSLPLRPAMIAGWACLVLWLARPGWLTDRIAAAGRAAFSNYLGTSIACALLFDGLGWFGRLSRAELLPVVIVVWIAMLAWSRPWLARLRYGPMEWAWRSAARGRLQPMRRAVLQPPA